MRRRISALSASDTYACSTRSTRKKRIRPPRWPRADTLSLVDKAWDPTGYLQQHAVLPARGDSPTRTSRPRCGGREVLNESGGQRATYKNRRYSRATLPGDPVNHLIDCEVMQAPVPGIGLVCTRHTCTAVRRHPVHKQVRWHYRQPEETSVGGLVSRWPSQVNCCECGRRHVLCRSPAS